MTSAPITTAQALELSHGEAVLISDSDGAVTALAVRHLFKNSGINHGRLGWSIADEEAPANEVLDDYGYQDALFDGGEIISFFDGTIVLTDFQGDEDDDDYNEKYDAWFDGTRSKLDALPIGTVLAIRDEGDEDAEPFAVKVSEANWKVNGCGWTSDDEATAVFDAATLSAITRD